MESASIDTTTGPAITSPAMKREIEMVIGINDHGVRGTTIETMNDLIEASIQSPPTHMKIYRFQTTKSLKTRRLNLLAIPG